MDESLRERARPAPKRLTVTGPPPSIGFLVDCLDDSHYQWAVLRGAMDAAYDRGAHLLCFVGGVLDAPSPDGGARNSVFDLARPKNVDALILLSGSIGKRAGLARLGEYCKRYQAMPVCSVAVELDGMSSVCIDNEVGMQAVLEHLVRVHGTERIAFVRGPQANSEAERRFAVYRGVLEKNGIAYSDQRVVQGDFEQASGKNAVRVLLEDRGLRPQDIGAIAAANDCMAFGVLDELAARGIRVPDEVTVVGFDDAEEARFTLPPLTTVRQPLYEQGRDAVRIVLDQLRNGVRPERVVRHTELVARRSCGCMTAHSSTTRVSEAPGARLGFEASLIRRREIILAEMSRAARGELSAAGAHWDERLLGAFAEQIRAEGSDAFVRAYDELLRRLSASGVDPSVCNDVVSALRSRMVRCLAGDPQRRARAEDLFHEARVMTAHVIDRVQAERRMHTWKSARSLGRAAADIASARDADELALAVRANLPALGIPRCFVLEWGAPEGAGRSARLALVQKPDGRAQAAPSQATYPAGEILRQHVLPKMGEHAFAILPMTFEGKDLGLLVLELGAVDGYLYETLREVFTAVLARASGPAA
ncbi:MAG: substrate-binding domain-containing protein [Myxococcota bacterium]|nr:substrate-binding domain-containing protein [Myxococcota bacterium]